MKSTSLALVLTLGLSMPAYASEVKDLTLSPNEASGLFNSLQTLGVKERICKDGANEKPCTEQIPLPAGVNLVIALDIRALRHVLEDYQYAQHKIIGATSGGTGYNEKGSKAEAETNFQLAELSRVPITIKLSTISRKELIAAKVELNPTIHALLLPILED